VQNQRMNEKPGAAGTEGATTASASDEVGVAGGGGARLDNSNKRHTQSIDECVISSESLVSYLHSTDFLGDT
jgi:hypothetical protein